MSKDQALAKVSLDDLFHVQGGSAAGKETNDDLCMY